MQKLSLFIALILLLVVGLLFLRSDSAPANLAVESTSATVEIGPESLDRPIEERRSTHQFEAGPLVVAPLTFQVTDVADVALPGARVELYSKVDGAVVDVGLTDDGGRVSSSLDTPYPADVWVSCPGYVSTELVLSQDPEDLIRVRLVASTVIGGRVVSRESGLGVEGMKILFWSQNLRLPAWDLAERALRKPDSRAAIGFSEKDGRFQVTGISPAGPYKAVAAGSGMASFDVADWITPGESSLVLEVGALYGVRVRVAHPEPAQQGALDCLAPSTVDPLKATVPDATYVYQPSFVSVLSGLDRELTYGSLTNATYLFVAEREVDAVGPAPYELHVPGFQPVITTVSFPRARERIHERIVPLSKADDSMGRCSFALRWPSGFSSSDVRMLGGLGFIRVNPIRASSVSGPPSELKIKVDPAQGDKWTINLPFGAYEARYVCTTGASAPDAPDPPRMILIGTEPVLVEFDLSHCGGVRVQLESPEANHLSGALSLMLWHGEPAAGAQLFTSLVFLLEAPYVVAPLIPGIYTISPLGHSSARLRPEQATFRVEPGRWGEATVYAE